MLINPENEINEIKFFSVVNIKISSYDLPNNFGFFWLVVVSKNHIFLFKINKKTYFVFILRKEINHIKTE